jgi:hypothetical protein
LAEARRGVVLIAPVFGALCVEAICDVSVSGIADHVLISVWMNPSVSVEWVVVEDSPVLYGGGSGKQNRGIRLVDGGN